MEAEAVGMVLLALSTILGAFAVVAKPMIQLSATITRLEAVLDTLQDKVTEVGAVIKNQDSRLDRAETTLTEHGMRLERLEEECERRRRDGEEGGTALEVPDRRRAEAGGGQAVGQGRRHQQGDRGGAGNLGADVLRVPGPVSRVS